MFKAPKRIVVTGLGSVSPLGWNMEVAWQKLIRGEYGIVNNKEGELPVNIRVWGKVPLDEQHSVSTTHREHSLFMQYALYAADQAIQDAKLPFPLVHPARTGVCIASGGIGSLQDCVVASKQLDVSYKKVSPYFVPKILGNMAAGCVSIKYGCKGPVHSVSTACAAGLHAIGDAYNFIRLGYADVMLAGGSESNLDPLTITGFSRLKALSPNTDPSTASRPFDRSRDGFVIAEGACVLVLEELSHALARNAPIIAEVTGYGMSGDGYHMTSPSPEGEGAARSMLTALKDANLQPSDIGYINAHATSTPVGDAIEIHAIDSVFTSPTTTTTTATTASRSQPLYMSSTKGATGHLLGAAGALESAFTCLALRDNIVPPTRSLVDSEIPVQSFQHVPQVGVHYATGEKVKEGDNINNNNNNSDGRALKHALKNSFGFGGTNASIVFSRYVK